MLVASLNAVFDQEQQRRQGDIQNKEIRCDKKRLFKKTQTTNSKQKQKRKTTKNQTKTPNNKQTPKPLTIEYRGG